MNDKRTTAELIDELLNELREIEAVKPPFQIGFLAEPEPVGVLTPNADAEICLDCKLATLPGFARCYYCEELDRLVRVQRDIEQARVLAARNEAAAAGLERLVQRKRRGHHLRDWIPATMLMAGAGMTAISVGWVTTAGMILSATGLLGLIWQANS